MKKLRMAPPSGRSSGQHFEAEFVRPRKGRTLIVGSHVYEGREDRRLRYPDAVGVDMVPGPGVDVVADLEEACEIGQFDHVECLSVLEHSRRPWLLAANLERLMKPGATIFLSVPFVWRLHGYPDDYWRMSPAAVRSIFPGVTWSALKLACEHLCDGPILPGTQIGGHVYLSKTETMGFGYR